MIRLLFVGDGKRDAVTVPHLVERLLEVSISEETRAWARLHMASHADARKPRGYARKVQYALRQARTLGVDGLVATVDTDANKKGSRLARMRQGRDADRETLPAFPTALGEATPHGEAWLLDDPTAVRSAMRMPQDVMIATVGKTKDPKRTLHDLLEQSLRNEERPLTVWAGIARVLQVERCEHARETGFHAFAKEVRSEIGPLSVDSRENGQVTP